jgi:predicted RND superfamily exporter protein
VDWIQKYRWGVIALWALLFAASVYVNSENTIDSDPLNYYADEVPIKKANDFLKNHFGGSRGIEFVLDTGRVDGVKDVDFLDKVVAFESWIQTVPGVAKVTSVADIVGELNQAMEGKGLPKDARMPASTDSVAQQLFLYSMSLPVGMGVNYWTTMDYKKMRIKILWNVENSEETLHKISLIENKAKEMGLNAVTAGKAALLPKMNHYILNTFNQANYRALLMIVLTMILLCRSFRLGLISMVPNAIPPVFAGGVIYLMGIKYDVGTVLVISVVMGIAVDDTIHFMTHFREMVKKGETYKEAVVHVFSQTGEALLVTNLVLSIGFGVAMLSDFIPFRNFGVMTVISLTFALTADWMLLPALLLTPGVGAALRDKKQQVG